MVWRTCWSSCRSRSHGMAAFGTPPSVCWTRAPVHTKDGKDPHTPRAVPSKGDAFPLAFPNGRACEFSEGLHDGEHEVGQCGSPRGEEKAVLDDLHSAALRETLGEGAQVVGRMTGLSLLYSATTTPWRANHSSSVSCAAGRGNCACSPGAQRWRFGFPTDL